MSGRYRDIAVIGAGAAGLAAGWTLAAGGCRVTLYDRRAVPGGRLRTDALDGVRADVVVQLLGSYYRETFRLAREVGASELLVRAPGRDALWRDRRAHPLTYGSPASMAASSALPGGLKFRLATRYLPFLRRHGDLLDANEPVRAERFDDESIAAWGRRELGEDFVELLVYPQLAAYYGGVPEETSAGFYHALAHAGISVALYAVRGGMGALAAAVLRGIEARGGRFTGGVEVRAVRPSADGVAIEWDEGSVRHDAAVLALPAAAAAAVMGAGADERLHDWLAGVRSNPAASLALLLEGPSPPGDFFGLSFPRRAPPGDRLAAICIEAQKMPPAEPGELRQTLVVLPAPAVAPELATAEPRELLDFLLPAVDQALPGVRPRTARAQAVRIAEGAVQFYPGYLRHLRRFTEDWVPPRLALAGDYRVAPTVEGAVRSGRRAAERLMRA
ncbi:MAG TPA: FAD-dependent oxidoreductase [Longimicrobiales bacterium]